VSDFGDLDDDDVVGTEPADAEQVARRLHELRLREGFEITDFDTLADSDRGALVQMIVVLLAWLRRQGSNF
jgi:hypothetical protein